MLTRAVGPQSHNMPFSHFTTFQETLNDTIATTEEALSNVRQVRLDAYFGTDGLADKFAGMKQAIKGQYGPSSPQYIQIKGIKW